MALALSQRFRAVPSGSELVLDPFWGTGDGPCGPIRGNRLTYGRPSAALTEQAFASEFSLKIDDIKGAVLR